MNHSEKVRTSIILTITLLVLHTMQLHGDTVIDLRKGDDLKVLFDGGVRPWRTPGLDRTHLEVGSSNFVLILSTGENFSLPVERGTFNVLEGNKLSACELFGQPTRVEEAIALTKKICSAVGVPVSGLDQLAGNLGTTPDPSKYWTAQNISRGSNSLQITFQPVFGFQGVTASVRVFLGWKRSPSEMHILSEPIKPPSGYEGISLEPPRRNPNVEPFPKHGPDYYRDLTAQAKLKDSQPSAPATPVQTATPAPLAPAPPVGENAAPVVERKSAVWPWLVGMIVLVVIVAVALKRRA